MLQHHHVPNQCKAETGPNFVQNPHKSVACKRASKIRSSPVTTESNEMPVLLSVTPLQRISFPFHRSGASTSKPAPLHTEGCGTHSLPPVPLKYRTGMIDYRFVRTGTKSMRHPANQYVYEGARLIAEYKAGTTYFVHADHLGTTRLLTAMNQSVFDSTDYLPFGEQISDDTGTTH